MARLEVNRSGEMEVFVRVVELGGFSAAARAFHMTPSAVSKLVGRLENRLGARLINRSTRQVQLTPEGAVFYERSLRLLADLEEAERGASAHGTPRGKLRVSASVPFGSHILLPLVPEFLALHPDISLDLMLTDEVIDILEQRADLAVRAGPLKSSSLVARKLGECRMLVIGSPSYLARHGTPRSIADLETHNRIGLNYARTIEGWPMRDKGGVINIPIDGNTKVGHGDGLRQLAIGGVGLARLAEYQVTEDIAAGRLVEVLQEFTNGDTEELHAVFLGHGGYLPLRVRVFLDFLVERVRV